MLNAEHAARRMEMDEEVQAAARDPGIQQGRHPLFTEQEVQGHRAHTVYVGVHLPGVKRKSHHRRHRPNQMAGGQLQPGQAKSSPPASASSAAAAAHGDDPEDSNKDGMSSIPEEDGTGVSWRRGSISSAITPGLPPSQRVQFILGEEIADGAIEPRPVFSELGELVSDGCTVEWQETARWIKFEEDVEEGGHRWSKPHVAALSLHSLLELRSLLLRAVLLFDLEATTLEQVADLAIEALIQAGQLPDAEVDKLEVVAQVRQALLRRHRHLHERHPLNARHLPLIRSIAEIGRTHSSCKSLQEAEKSPSIRGVPAGGGFPQAQAHPSEGPHESKPFLALPVVIENKGEQIVSASPRENADFLVSSTPLRVKVLGVQEEHHTHSVHCGGAGAHQPSIITPLLKLYPGVKRTASGHSLKNGNLDSEAHHKGNTHLMRKIPAGAEASNILVGEVDFLEKCLCVLIRLKEAVPLGDLAEVPVPTRFIFLLLGPSGEPGQLANGNLSEAPCASDEKPSVASLEGRDSSHGNGNGHGKPGQTKCTVKPGASFHEVGRAMATIMTDEVFTEIAYRAKNRHHILTAVDEFLDSVTVLPPGEWDPSIRIEPPPAVPSQEQRKRLEKNSSCSNEDEEILEAKRRQDSGLTRSGKCFGGVINDIKRKIPWYWSDFRDACSLQCVASWIFLYFACLSPIITFGGLLGQATDQNMAAMESLISGFVCGIGYGLFSGQPLTILGSTGPVLVFETIMFDLCQWVGWDYLSFRLWVGLWIGVILLILVAVDASALVCYITRFTEENFATLIAFIFICKALENVMHISDTYPTNRAVPVDGCLCLPPAIAPGVAPEIVPANYTPENNWTLMGLEDCLSQNGVWSASSPKDASCTPPVPDVFLMSLLLFAGTFIISVILKDFKNSLFFPTSVRRFISDFAVIIAIFSMTLLDLYMGIDTPKLEVPTEFKPTRPDRGWIIIPSSKTPLWTIPLAIIPALLGTILIFMDQQITSVIVNRSENKLKKGCGYHLDLLILAILIVVCTIMGLPWFVAATVLSINHVNSLKQESECAAPGEKPRFLGVREQRVTHVAIFVTIGLSVGLTPVLKRIPMPVLFGVFLYMGVASLKGLQLFHRLLLVFMPVKYQPDYMYLRQVPLWRVHLFTGIQLACLIILWAVKSFSITSVFFPLMLVVMIGVRKALDCVFTQRELKILDDVMPEHIQRTEEYSANANGNTDEEKGLAMAKSDSNLQIPLTNGNVIKIPLSSINITEEMNKTSIWRQLDSGSTQTQQQQPLTTLIQTPQGSISTKIRRGSKEEECKRSPADGEGAPGGEVTAL